MAYDPWIGFSVSLDRVVEQLDAMNDRPVPGDEVKVRSQLSQAYATVACAHALWRIGTILETDQKWRDQLKRDPRDNELG